MVSPDPEVLAVAEAAGAASRSLQRSRGLNPALQEAREAATAASGCSSSPATSPPSRRPTSRRSSPPATPPDRPSVVLAPDRHGRGTNALLLDPPDVIDPAFGGDSRAGHAWLAVVGRHPRSWRLAGVLALDLDTPDDLLLAEALRRGGASHVD